MRFHQYQHQSSIPHLSTLLILASIAAAAAIIVYASESMLLQLAYYTAEKNHNNVVANSYIAVKDAGGNHLFAAGFVMICLMTISWLISTSKAITRATYEPDPDTKEEKYLRFRASNRSVTSICKHHSKLHQHYLVVADVIEIFTRSLADLACTVNRRSIQDYTWSTPIIATLIAASIWCIFEGSGNLFFDAAHHNLNSDTPTRWAQTLGNIEASGANLPLLAAGTAYILAIGAPLYRRATCELITMTLFTSSTIACIGNHAVAITITAYLHHKHPHSETDINSGTSVDSATTQLPVTNTP